LLACTFFALVAGVLASRLVPNERWAELRSWYRASPILEMPSALVVDECERGEVVARDFEVRNRGWGILVLDQFHTSCACTVLEQSVDGKPARLGALRLKHGERSKLIFRASVASLVGVEFSEGVYFRTNDPQRLAASLLLTVRNVRGGLLAIPDRLGIEEVSVGKKVAKTISIRDPSRKPRRVIAVRSTDPSVISAQFVPEPSSGDGTETGTNGVRIGRVEVEINPSRPGFITAEIRIAHSDEESEDLVVPVAARVTPVIETVPAVVLLPRYSNSGLLFSTEILCRNTDGQPFDVTADGLPPDVTCLVTKVDGDPSAARIRVEWKPRKNETNSDTIDRLRFRARAENRITSFDIPMRFQYSLLSRMSGQRDR
jgi:hypothetical protein